MNTEDTLSGFQYFSLQPIIKDRSNTSRVRLFIANKPAVSFQTYKLRQRMRGRAIILYNEVFIHSQNDVVFTKDVQDLRNLFTQLFFEPVVHHNKSSQVKAMF